MRKTFSLALLAAASVLALSLTGCGTKHSPVAASQSKNTAAQTVVVSEHTLGKTVHVQVGTKVELLLHSSYWTIAPSPRPSVLSENGRPVVLKPASACPPGAGCSPVAATFTAAAPGTVMLTANRTSCGEAMMCSPSQRHYQVTVVVTG